MICLFQSNIIFFFIKNIIHKYHQHTPRQFSSVFSDRFKCVKAKKIDLIMYEKF